MRIRPIAPWRAATAIGIVQRTRKGNASGRTGFLALEGSVLPTTPCNGRMIAMKPVEYAEGSVEVRAVFDDIKRTRNVPDVNNFWKYLAHDPAGLKRTWESIKEVMAPGALDPLLKEMVY